MKNFKSLLSAALLSITAITVSACGNGTDPLQLFDQATPELNSILATGGYTLTAPYTPSTPYWVFSGFTGSLNAPASGFVAEIGIDTVLNNGSYFVRIIHNGRLSTRISGITQAVLVRSGDTVVGGQPIGTFFGGQSSLQVILDNKSVCPLSYMSDAFRAVFFTGATNNPCR